jgi:tetratricopeptide (TPR) repeat protein
MPRYSHADVAHAASTDHRIVRRPTSQPIRAADLETAELVDFYRDRFPAGDPQSARTLGLGLSKMIAENKLQPWRHGDRALRFLEMAVARDPSDPAVRGEKVDIYLRMKRSAEALNEAEVLVSKQPGNWQLLALAAYAAPAQGEVDRATDYWRRVVEINPYEPDFLARLLGLLLEAGQLEEAGKRCEQLLRVDPFNVSGRQARVRFLFQEGKKAEAAKEFEVIRRLKPPDLAQREEWFRQRMR